MEHEHAVESQLAEQYLLGELSDADAEAFEAHYFDCRVCAADVRDGLRLLDGGRELARRDTARVVPIAGRRRQRWLQAAAAVVVLVGATSIAVVAGRDAAPSMEVAQPLSLLMSEARGADASDVVANEVTLRPDEPLVIYVDIPADASYPQYELRVRGGGSGDLASTRVSAEQARNTVNVLLRDLQPGTYEVVVEGVGDSGRRTAVATDQFTVRRTEE